MVARPTYVCSLVLVVAALGVAACGSKSPPEAVSPDDSSSDESDEEADVTDDEAAAMASIEEYLSEEGGDSSADDAAESDAAAATTEAPKGGAVERRDQLWALVKEKRPSVANCYKMAKKTDPGIGTKIAVRIVLKPDGTLKQDPEVVAEMSDITNADVKKCAVDVVKSITYPPHPKGMETTFTYPFGF